MSSSSALLTLQNDVNTLFSAQEKIKTLRAEMKVINQLIKAKTESIIDYMKRTNIRSCMAGQVCLTVEEKQRLPPLTTKVLGPMVREHFNINENLWNEFMGTIQEDRERNGKTIRCLTKKNTNSSASTSKAPAPKVVGPGVPLPPPLLTSTENTSLASTVDSLYG